MADGHPQVAVGEAVWIEKEEREAKRNGENFHLCLVGHWVEHVDFVPDFSSLRKWVAEVWGVEGKVQLKWLEGPFFLFKFELLSDVQKTFHVRCRLFEGKLLLLDRCLLLQIVLGGKLLLKRVG